MPTLPLEFTTRALEPTVRSEEKRLVDEAVVEKRLVVVALVVVLLRAVKFWRVEEPVAKRLSMDSVPVAVKLVAVKVPAM